MFVANGILLKWLRGTGWHAYDRMMKAQMQSLDRFMIDKWRCLWRCGERVSTCI